MIYVDVSAAVHARAGLGRYAERLALALHQQQPDRFGLFHNSGPEAKIPAVFLSAGIPRRSVSYGYKPWRMMIWLAQLGRIPFNRLVPNVELFHSTEHLLMPLRGVPTVLTVHDLIYKLFPEHHKPLNYWYLNSAMPLFCRRADAIVAVSEATKRDIVEHYRIDPAKIHVVYEAAADHFQPATAEEIAQVRQKHNLPDKFLVHLSTIEPRKNLTRLVDALQIVRQTIPDLQLILVGAKGWLYDDFFAKIAAENLQDTVRALGWVEDDELAAVLGAAALAVQPSLYEGFGLPVLEHMAAGQVVAASNTSSLPEVGGEAAAYFDPENTEEMAAVIHRLLTSPDEYQQRHTLGFQQAAKFSWRTAALQTINIYDQLLSQK